MIEAGKNWVFDDDVNTDLIYPGRYTYKMLSEAETASHAGEDLDADFNKNAAPGDIIVAGSNWGGGSAREQAARSLRFRGIAAIIAASFARVYYRNAINEGIPVIICPELSARRREETVAHIDLENGKIYCTGGAVYEFAPYAGVIMEIIEGGGLVNYVRKKVQERGLAQTE